MLDHCAIPQEVQIHVLCCFSHLTKSYLPPFITIVRLFEESLIPFLPQFHSAGEAHETIISHSALLFMWNGGLFRNVTWAPLLQLPVACFQDLDCSCNYFGRSILGSCIIDGLCFYCGSLINIYEDLEEKEQLHHGWISIFTDLFSSAIFLFLLQPLSAETSTPRCNMNVLCDSWNLLILRKRTFLFTSCL